MKHIGHGFEDAALATVESTAEELSLSIHEWADQRIMVPRGSGIQPHRSSVCPYWRHWLDLIRGRITGSEPDAPEIAWLIGGAQLCKTFGFLAPTLGWLAALHPRDVGVVLPGFDAVKEFQGTKMRRMFDNSPRLAELMPTGSTETERRLGNRVWELARSSVYYRNGQVAMELRRNDLPVVLLDEFDALPQNVDGEGSPLALAWERTKTYPHERFMGGITTPGAVDSHGWQTLCAATHERLFIACVKCGAHQWLDHERIEIPKGLSPDDIMRADAARWRCLKCGHKHNSDDRTAAVRAACAVRGWTAAGGWVAGEWSQRPDGTGLWVPAAEPSKNTGRIADVPSMAGRRRRSGWLNSLYSTISSVSEFWSEGHTAAHGTADMQQSYTNNWLALPWMGRVDSAKAEDVDRISVVTKGYQHGQLPFVAWRLTLTADQQGITEEASWFPYVVRAWSEEGESWLVEAGEVKGFAALTALCARSWPIGGVARQVDLIAVDTANGTMVRPIRLWCAKDARRRVSLSGSGSMSPETPYSEMKLTPKNHARMGGLAVAYYHNAHLFRDETYNRIMGLNGAPGWHLPSDVPDFYRESLTAEERIPQDVTIRGRRIRRLAWTPRTWTNPNGSVHVRDDNHWWDCEVQAVALVTVKNWFKAKRAPSTTTHNQKPVQGDWMAGYH